MTTPTETADMTTTEDPAPALGYIPKEVQGLEIDPTSHHRGSKDCSARAEEDYPESEMDDWDWDDLEQSPLKEPITRIKLREKTPSPSQNTSPHSGQDTLQRNSEGQQDKSTNHNPGGLPNPIDGNPRVVTNTTVRTMQPMETPLINKDPLLTTTIHYNHEEEGRNTEDDYLDREVDNLDWDVLEQPLNRGTITECESTSPLPTSLTCEQRQAHLLLCPANCGCKNSMPRLAEKFRAQVIKDYGL